MHVFHGLMMSMFMHGWMDELNAERGVLID